MADWANTPWRDYAAQLPLLPGSELLGRVERALASPAVAVQRDRLGTRGLRLDPNPMLWKYLPDEKLRLFFPVSGPSARVELGDVIALVLLYDVDREQALYAHPVHASPGTNPLLKHLDGPMAQPKAQSGSNGDRATRRLLEHKQALWMCLAEERESLGEEEAGCRWRERYAWSLVRLYFCERCPGCAWGSPFFEGQAGEPHRSESARARPEPVRCSGWETVAASVRQSDIWRVEVSYARRGGFTILNEPQLVIPVGRDARLAVFPSDVDFVEAGCIVGLAVYADAPAGPVRYAHCLSAGPDPEMIFLRGDRSLALPLPGSDPAARDAYARWRREAWSRFWLDELEQGIDAASGRWLRGFWEALGRLLTAAPEPTAARGAENP